MITSAGLPSLPLFSLTLSLGRHPLLQCAFFVFVETVRRGLAVCDGAESTDLPA